MKEDNKDIFRAIADPTRRAILVIVAASALTPNALAVQFDTSRQAVSKHIRVLSEAGLLRQKKSGREIYYTVNHQKLKQVDKWLAQFRKLWEERFDQLDKLLTNL